MAISTSRMNILIVENDQSSAQKMISLLNEAGADLFQVAQAKELQDALEILSHKNFDIVVINLFLPDSGGFYTLNKLKSYLHSTPFVVINGPDDDEVAHKALNEGATDYVAKTEMESGAFIRSIRYAHERAKGMNLQRSSPENIKSIKLAAAGRVADDVTKDIQPPVDAIHAQIGDLKKELLEKKVLSDKAHTLLKSAEGSARDIKGVVADLIQFSKELSLQIKEEDAEEQASYHILLVEDDPKVAEVILKRLQRLSQTDVEIVTDGKQAYNKCIQCIRESRPLYDLIISDWKMPKMTGIDLLENIRSNHFLRNIPFMMISAVDERREIEKAVELKVSQYLLKPFTKEEFDKRFRRLLYHVS